MNTTTTKTTITNKSLLKAATAARKTAMPSASAQPAEYHRQYRARAAAHKLLEEIQMDIEAGSYFDEALFKSWTEEVSSWTDLTESIYAYKSRTRYYRAKNNTQKQYMTLLREALKAYKTNAHAKLSLIIKRAAEIGAVDKLKEDLLRKIG